MDGIPDWAPVAALVIAAISAFFGGANYFAAQRERQRNSNATPPEVKATINATGYKHGWRSVQLHIGSASDTQNFQYGNWRILRAQLLHPSSAVLARAENDDYATGVFYPESPVRALAGKREGLPQRFALEFFIKFEGDDRGQKAKFKVSFSRMNDHVQRTVTVWAVVPNNAASPKADTTPAAPPSSEPASARAF